MTARLTSRQRTAIDPVSRRNVWVPSLTCDDWFTGQGEVELVQTSVEAASVCDRGGAALLRHAPRGSLGYRLAAVTGACLLAASIAVVGSTIPASAGNPAVAVSGTSYFYGVACSSATTCEAVGANSTEGVVDTITNGNPGTAQAVPGTSALYGVACPSATSCEAVGGNSSGEGVVVPITSGTPGSVKAVTGTDELIGVACTTAASCEAVGRASSGDGGVVVATTGGTPGSVQAVGGTSSLEAVACPSATSCEAVGGNSSDEGAVVPITSGTPGSAKAVAGTSYLEGVACSSASTCETGGYNPSDQGVLVPITSGSAGSVQAVEGTNYLRQVTCPSATRCEAVGENYSGQGVVVAITSGTLGVAQAALGTAYLLGVACPSASSCEAVGRSSTGGEGVVVTIVIPANAYTALAPSRLLDTRISGQSLGPGDSLNLTVTGGSVPADAAAVALNVTVTGTSSASDLTVYPAGEAEPSTSNLNWVAGETVPNLVIVPVGTDGQVTFANALGQTNVLADLEGYFAPEALGSTGSTAGSYVPLPPARITDTRSGSGYPNAGSTLQPGGILNVQVDTAGGVPASGVSAVLLNVTVTNTSSASDLTVYPTNDTEPGTSNLNWVAGDTVANRVVVPVGAGGKITVANDAGTTDVIVDVNGYFTDGSSTPSNASLYTPITPTRLVDTRAGSGYPGAGSTLGAGGIYPAQISGNGGISSSATSAVLNVTATNTSSPSNFTVYPGGTTPGTSDLNWVTGQTVPNLTVATLSETGAIDVYNAAGSADLIIDAFGYFSPLPVPAMVSVVVTTTDIAITYNVAVSCPATGADSDFVYYSASTVHGGTATGCRSAGDVLTLTGSFTLPTGTTGRLLYAAPATSTTANAVHVLNSTTDFAATQTLPVGAVPAMVSASVTTTAIAITYNEAVSCPITGADSDFVYWVGTVHGGVATSCSTVGDVLYLTGSFTLPTGSDGSIEYFAPATSTTLNAVYATSVAADFAASQTIDLAAVPAMVSASVTTTAIAITYNEAVSCPATAADSDFAYDYTTGTSGVTALTGCATSGDVLTLTGSFTLPLGSTGSIVYTAPATSTTSNAVYATGFPTEFSATQTLRVAAVPAMVSAVVTTTSLAITYNEAVSCPATGADSNFVYWVGTVHGGTATGCSTAGDVLTLTGSFTLPTGSDGSIEYFAPITSTTANSVYATSVTADYASSQTIPGSDVS